MLMTREEKVRHEVRWPVRLTEQGASYTIDNRILKPGDIIEVTIGKAKQMVHQGDAEWIHRVRALRSSVSIGDHVSNPGDVVACDPDTQSKLIEQGLVEVIPIGADLKSYQFRKSLLPEPDASKAPIDLSGTITVRALIPDVMGHAGINIAKGEKGPMMPDRAKRLAKEGVVTIVGLKDAVADPIKAAMDRLTQRQEQEASPAAVVVDVNEPQPIPQRKGTRK